MFLWFNWNSPIYLNHVVGGGEIMMNDSGNRISNSWSASNSNRLRCPVPGCTHKAEIITKAHCRIEHDMERDEVKKKYGMPIIVEAKAGFGGASNRGKWYSTSNSNGNLI